MYSQTWVTQHNDEAREMREEIIDKREAKPEPKAGKLSREQIAGIREKLA